MNSNESPPPRYPSPLPQIPPLDKLPRLELSMQPSEDDEPTIKMQVPPHLLHLSCRPEPKYQGPNWGLLLGLAFCLAFWGSIIYLIAR